MYSEEGIIQSIHSSLGANIESDEGEIGRFLRCPFYFASTYTFSVKIVLVFVHNGIKNIMEDQYPLISLSIILKSYLARKRRLADGDTKRKLTDTLT